MSNSYTRHSFAIILDVPVALAANGEQTEDVLNGIVTRITELIEADSRLQAFLRREGVELGWEPGSWEIT
jgi:hypothetical protein